jgi:hypothetical protein
MKCAFSKCKGESHRTDKAGRFVRNIINSFEFETSCGCDEASDTMSYD